MELSVNGKGLDVGDALRQHIAHNLSEVVNKYFSRALDATVTMSREARLFRADILVHPKRGVLLQGEAKAEDGYVAFDQALERIAKQLRRYKRRLLDQHKRRGGDEAAEETTAAHQYIIAAGSDEEELPADGQPAIIAELQTEIATLGVGEAVMRMDLANSPVMMFRNRAHGGLNVIYRRSDGNIGWIDPAVAEKA